MGIILLGSFYIFSQFQNIKLALKHHHVALVVRGHDVNTRQVTSGEQRKCPNKPNAATFSG